jgi:hypothetical protein
VKATLVRIDAGTRHGTRLVFAHPAARRTVAGLLRMVGKDRLSPVSLHVDVQANTNIRLLFKNSGRMAVVIVSGETDAVRVLVRDPGPVGGKPVDVETTMGGGEAEHRGHIYIKNLVSWLNWTPSWDDQFPTMSNAMVAEVMLAGL